MKQTPCLLVYSMWISVAEKGEGKQMKLAAELENHLEGAVSATWRNTWLPKQASCALACLITACALRPGVELKKALAIVQQGLQRTCQGLEEEGTDSEVRYISKLCLAHSAPNLNALSLSQSVRLLFI